MQGRLHRHTADKLQAKLHTNGHGGVAVIVGAVYAAATLASELQLGSGVLESSSHFPSPESSVTGSSLRQSPEHSSVHSRSNASTASSQSSDLSGEDSMRPFESSPRRLPADSMRKKSLRSLHAVVVSGRDGFLSEYGRFGSKRLGFHRLGRANTVTLVQGVGVAQVARRHLPRDPAGHFARHHRKRPTAPGSP